MVIAIYTAIIVRFFLLNDHGESTTIIDSPATFVPEAYSIGKEFVIKNDHRDPFLKTIVKKQQKKKPPASVPKKMEDPFPEVRYLGLISDTQGGKKIFSIAIDGVQYVLALGDKAAAIEIRSGNADEVTVSHKGKHRTIKITN